MKERPILFSGPMVRAILDGRKTMTRRVLKRQPHEGVDAVEWQDHIIVGMNVPDQSGFAMMRGGVIESEAIRCPYGAPGDRLWVREAFGYPEDNKENGIVYRATDQTWDDASTKHCKTMLWKPSIHMPRWASRINLEITGVRVERLQDISETDAIAEGVVDDGRPGMVYPNGAPPIVNAFWRLWNKLNEARGFGLAKNPWVWVVEFRRVDP